jgi:hypothetical protein
VLTSAEWLLLGVGLGTIATWVSLLVSVVFLRYHDTTRSRRQDDR